MRILQINSICDKDSTGRTTRELAEALQAEGHECFVAYGYGTSSYSNSFKIASYPENLLHNALFSRLLGLHGYGTIHGTLRLVKWIKHNKPDIIHLRNLHAHYLNYPILFKYIIKHNIPVVFTLHDCFNFTGKCTHYTTIGCYKWQTECNHCPVFRETIAQSCFFDFSRHIFKEKKRLYSKMKNMTVVAVSKWLMGEAERSILAGNGHKVTYIYNWIDYRKFHGSKEEDMETVRNKYGLLKDYKYLISVSAGWDKRRSKFQDAIKLSELLPVGYKLVLVGSTSNGTIIPDGIIHIPYIDGTPELSAIYSISEAYVHFSVEDTFGKVIAEAMSCGIVPITFDSTACGEIPGKYGIIVKPHDIRAIVNSLPKIDSLKSKKEEMIQFVEDNYDYHTNAHKYLNEYKELLDRKVNDNGIQTS